ncbi:MAG: hypothetical protein M3536_12625 [Actinomycetota bacterium]|nr:hypothetical protein [Actinomycetota bacterium]
MTTNTHAAPWTFRRFLAMLTPAPRKPRVDVLTGREAVARALFFEAVQGSKLDMLNYDASPHLRGVWLVEADRRIAVAPSIPDLLVLRWWGYTPAEWNALNSLVKADKREGYFQVRGL